MKNDISHILISKEKINEMVESIGRKITEDYRGKELVVVGVLKGGFVFMADLIRHIDLPLQLDFISVSSYGATTQSTGVVRIIKDIDIDITGKHVILVEDIIDSGLTLAHLKELFTTRDPLSVKICTAFDKPSRRKVDIKADYTGIEVPDEFIVGYGLDFAEKYRNYPEVGVLKPELYK